MSASTLGRWHVLRITGYHNECPSGFDACPGHYEPEAGPFDGIERELDHDPLCSSSRHKGILTDYIKHTCMTSQSFWEDPEHEKIVVGKYRIRGYWVGPDYFGGFENGYDVEDPIDDEWFSPFGREDPRITLITKADAELLTGRAEDESGSASPS